jgi:2-dehydropantoate 2-reductase
MKIAVIGIGAMGCLFASLLHGLADVIMLGEWPEQIAALRAGGLRVRYPGGDERHFAVRASNTPADAGQVDLALILVKSHKTDGAAALAQRVTGPEGMALTLQNGLGNLEIIQRAMGARRAALGVTSQGAAVVAPGLLQAGGPGPTYLASQPAAIPLAEIAILFRQAGMACSVLDDVDTVLWGKLAVNAAINPLTALLETPNGFLAAHDSGRRLMLLAAEEAVLVARAQGIALGAGAAHRAIDVAQATASNRSSMLQDIDRGEPTEINAISGQVVTLGQKLGLATPVNEALWRLVTIKTAGGDWRREMAGLPGPIGSLLSELLALEASA